MEKDKNEEVDKEKYLEFIKKFKIKIDGNQFFSKKIHYELFCAQMHTITEPFEFEKDFRSLTSKKYLNPIDLVVFMEKFQQNKSFTIKQALVFSVNNNNSLSKKSKVSLLVSIEKYIIMYLSLDSKESDVAEFMNSYKSSLKITLYDLQQFLYNSELNNALDFSREDSMDHPMTDYYIYSSHNTYLKGDQILGK